MTLTWAVVITMLAVRLLWRVLARCRMHHRLILAGLVWFFWPELTALRAHERVQAVDPTAILADLRAIAAEPAVLDVAQCTDEEVARCYSQLRGQTADQLGRSLARL